MKTEIVAKLKLPMPINEGLQQVTKGLEKLYGPCFCGTPGVTDQTAEDGWWLIWREVKEAELREDELRHLAVKLDNQQPKTP